MNTGVACDEYAYYPRDVTILLAASCFRNQLLLISFKSISNDDMFTMAFWFSLYIKVNPTYVSQIEEKGMKFVARDVAGERMEIMEIPGVLIKINDTPQGTWVQQFTNICLWATGKTHYFHITSSAWHLVRTLWLLITFLRSKPRLPLKKQQKKFSKESKELER